MVPISVDIYDVGMLVSTNNNRPCLCQTVGKFLYILLIVIIINVLQIQI